MTSPAQFPDAFLWGAATSAYQIEGSPLADGAAPGVWHRFSHTKGNVRNDDTGDVACDHYLRWAEDVELMSALGLNAYRFGLNWGRILPEGRGRVNAKGLDFYSRLVDRLLERGIAPCVTLYHWDLPVALDDRGGWLNPDVESWFGDFAEVCYRALGDRVRMWMTLNEPWVVMDAGYLYGVNAPGHRNRYEAPIATHHMMLAHGEAVRRYRGIGTRAIGVVVNLEPKDPATDSPEDAEVVANADAYNNHYHLDAALLGRYPDRVRALFGDAWQGRFDTEVARAREPLDFVGVNYYTRRVIRHDPEGLLGWSDVTVPDGVHMETGWEVHPQGLTRTLLAVRERYGVIPIHVTENGSAFADPPVANADPLPDPLRVECLRGNLGALSDAIAQGVDVRGYFAWSLLDNFEWSSGYHLRFGLYHVDYATQKRTLKTSGAYYRDAIARHRGATGAPRSAGSGSPRRP